MNVTFNSDKSFGDLSSIWERGELCDVSLVASDGEIFETHKLLLSSHSPLFRRCLSAHHQATGVKPILFLFGLLSKDIKSILQYLYSDKIVIPSSQVKSFLNTAKLLEITSLCDDNEPSSAPSQPPPPISKVMSMKQEAISSTEYLQENIDYRPPNIEGEDDKTKCFTGPIIVFEQKNKKKLVRPSKPAKKLLESSTEKQTLSTFDIEENQGHNSMDNVETMLQTGDIEITPVVKESEDKPPNRNTNFYQHISRVENNRLDNIRTTLKMKDTDLPKNFKSYMEKLCEQDIKTGKWSCAVCGMKGMRKTVEAHAQIHIQGLKYPCKSCSYVGRHVLEMKEHIRRAHSPT